MGACIKKESMLFIFVYAKSSPASNKGCTIATIGKGFQAIHQVSNLCSFFRHGIPKQPHSINAVVAQPGSIGDSQPLRVDLPDQLCLDLTLSIITTS